MFRPLGTLPAIIVCATAFFSGAPCLKSAQSLGQNPPPPSAPVGPIIVGDPPVTAAPPPAIVAPATAASPTAHDDTAPSISAPTVTVPPPAAGDPAKLPSQALPAKDASSPYATATSPYVIGSLDVLDIKVWNAPNLSGFFEVGPDGMISMPLLGELRGDGVTKEELTKTIREKLATSVFTEPPEVNVQVARVNSKKYYVFGPVFHGGEFPLLGRVTVLDAFALVGGFQDFANKKGIYIQRADPTAKNGVKTLKFNYNDVSHGKHMEQNIQLQNGDRIFVP